MLIGFIHVNEDPLTLLDNLFYKSFISKQNFFNKMNEWCDQNSKSKLEFWGPWHPVKRYIVISINPMKNRLTIDHETNWSEKVTLLDREKGNRW